MIPARLNIVCLGVRDLAKVRAFYEALGWRSVSYGEEFARFEVGGAVLTLYLFDLLAKEAGARGAAPGEFKGFTCAVNVETEEMVDAAMETVRAAGGRVLAEPVAREWGGRSGYFADPEGSAWEVAWLPGSSFDERGALVWPTG